jgi:hypothetical protein
LSTCQLLPSVSFLLFCFSNVFCEIKETLQRMLIIHRRPGIKNNKKKSDTVSHQRPVPRAVAPEGQWLHDKAPAGPAKARNVPARTPIAPSGPAAAAINNALLVSNLHYEITPKDLIVRPHSLSTRSPRF